MKKKLNFKKISYDELFALMDKSDSSGLNYSKYFWHYTHINNLVSIVETGYFKARDNNEINISFDAKIKNNVTKDVMSSNASKLLTKHVRFYLRPKNAPYFRYVYDLKEEKKNIVYICIDRLAIKNARYYTFLYHRNAHSADDEIFNEINHLNKRQDNKISLNELFDFELTYSHYDNNVNPDSNKKNYQQAEFLVFKKLSIFYIKKIYFTSCEIMNNFLHRIEHLNFSDSRGENRYLKIKERCIVDETGDYLA